MTRPGRGERRSGPPPRPQAPALGRGDLHGGRRPGPQAASFLRAATGARPSYGSPLVSPEARARPGWRAMYTPAPLRAGGSGTASARLRSSPQENRGHSPTGDRECPVASRVTASRAWVFAERSGSGGTGT